MKYTLIQMTDGAIDIVDNHDSIGKMRVCRLIDEGGRFVGTIDSDLRPGMLRAGFEHCERIRNDKLYDQIRLAREALNGDIAWEKVHPPESTP